jgi:hypothetical protein
MASRKPKIREARAPPKIREALLQKLEKRAPSKIREALLQKLEKRLIREALSSAAHSSKN